MSLGGFQLIRNLSPYYRTVHRLPGRLRIHIPLLEKLDSKWHAYTALVTDVVRIKKGINDVHIQPISGRVLIFYETERIGETEIKQWIKRMIKTFLNTGNINHKLSEEEFVAMMDLIKDQLSYREP